VHIRGSVERVDDRWNGTLGEPTPIFTGENPPTFRIGVFTSRGYDDALSQQGAEDHSGMAERGYMQDDRDWKNIEITGYFRMLETHDSGEEITIYARGAKHCDFTNGGDLPPCELEEQCQGAAYKPGVGYGGGGTFKKEYYHDGGNGYAHLDDEVNEEFGLDSIMDRWVGVKAVLYNVDAGGSAEVRIEVYVDDQANGDWQLFYALSDEGDFPGEEFVVQNCGADSASEVFSWGGPIVAFRLDEAESVDFKHLSVREIVPPN
jgi:hypothetical protein